MKIKNREKLLHNKKYYVIIFPFNFLMERVTGIGPAESAWKAGSLPLTYTRIGLTCLIIAYFSLISTFFFKIYGIFLFFVL